MLQDAGNNSSKKRYMADAYQFLHVITETSPKRHEYEKNQNHRHAQSLLQRPDGKIRKPD